MTTRSSVTGACAAAVAMAWASSAHAHPGYPALLDKSLALSKTVETTFPPTGCQLCHNSTAGGDQLKAFGSLLVSTYGLSNSTSENDPSLEQALLLLKMGDPAAVTDLENGVDPNGDPKIFQGALPTPDYGCSATSSPANQEASWIAVVAVAAVVSGARRRRMR